MDTSRNPNRRNRKPPPRSGLQYVPWVPPRLRWLALRMYAAGWHDAMTARAARPGGRGGPGGVGGRPIAGPGQGHRRGAGAVSPGAPRTVRAEAQPDVVFGVEEWIEVTESPPEADVSASDEFDEEWSPNRDADGSQSEDDDEFAILEEEETVVVADEEQAPVPESAMASPKPRRTTRGAAPKPATSRKSARSSTSSAHAGGSSSSGTGARAGSGRASKKSSSPPKKSTRSARSRNAR